MGQNEYSKLQGTKEKVRHKKNLGVGVSVQMPFSINQKLEENGSIKCQLSAPADRKLDGCFGEEKVDGLEEVAHSPH